MRLRRAARAVLAGVSTLSALAVAGQASADPSDLQQIAPLVWTMIAISVGGAILTYAVLAYAIWKFRDPETKGLRYG